MTRPCPHDALPRGWPEEGGPVGAVGTPGWWAPLARVAARRLQALAGDPARATRQGLWLRTATHRRFALGLYRDALAEALRRPDGEAGAVAGLAGLALALRADARDAACEALRLELGGRPR